MHKVNTHFIKQGDTLIQVRVVEAKDNHAVVDDISMYQLVEKRDGQEQLDYRSIDEIYRIIEGGPAAKLALSK